MKKTIEQIKEEMKGCSGWFMDRWYNYLKALDEETRTEVFELINKGEIK